MNQTNSSKQVLLSVIGVAILVVAVVGVSFAFFNYTRTGSANTVRTGTIYFTSSNDLISVSNLFPVSREDSRIDSATNAVQNQDIVGVAVVTIEGYTTYDAGIDYVVTAEDVDFNIDVDGQPVQLPISVRVTQEGLGTAVDTTKNFTSADSLSARKDYTQLGGSNEDKYQLYSYELPRNTVVDSTDRAAFITLDNGYLLAKGHIATNTDLGSRYLATSDVNAKIAGKITIRAYIDKDMIAITDTRASEGNGNITVSGYENGTTEAWIGGRTVFTTAQWNSLNAADATFRIKVVAGETHTVGESVTGDATAIIGAY
jgi:hypothetical protein